MHIKGRAWTFGRNVNTDLIYPKMWFRPTYEPGEICLLYTSDAADE